ncbi:MAG: cell division protein FtsW [Oscillospiraceae bacterium]|nr:cell division protein FtsW [Oscillospiraceae bacterium]
MTREEQIQLKREQKRELRRREREAWEAARGPLDLPFLLLVLILLGIGLIMLLSASFPSAQAKGDAFFYIKRQLVFAALGVVAMFWVGKINYQRFRGVANIALIVSIILLVLVIIPGVGITRNNATRWLGIPGTGAETSLTFQPTEIAKLGVIVFFAASISKKRDRMRTFKEGILPYGVILVIIAVLVLLEPHMSGAILLVGIGAVMMVVGGIHWLWVAGGVGLGSLGVYLLLFTDLMEKIGYNSHRITTWRDPFWDALDKSFQMAQSFITIGSGGLLGVGLGKSRQKFMFLPEEHNDFIFSVVCEELGLVGATLIMLLFALLIIRGYWLAIHARDRFGSLLVVGVITQIALQTFLNIAVVSGLIPATGISLPFFSYGGTALAIQLAEMGIVLSVSRQIPAPKSD